MAGGNQKKPVEWHFPSTGGGIEQSFFHSGQESFKSRGIWNNAVRETIQNSLDASGSREKPVHVQIDRSSVPTSEIGSRGLLAHVRATLKEADAMGNTDASKMYKNAVRILQDRRIDVLSIIDSNTTGLRPSNLEALVYKEGMSEKSGNAGGSFGIGKHAIFSVSAVRTVFYSTTYRDGGKVDLLIGKAILATHCSPRGRDRLQHVGFGTTVAVPKGSRPAPMSGRDIRGTFRLKRPGTGVFVLGFDPSMRKWMQEAVKSVACNFFTAVHRRKLEVDICGKKIDADSVGRILSDLGTVNQLSYYQALVSPNGTKELDVKGAKFTISYLVNRDGLPNRVAYVNRKGMLITDSKQRGTNPFAAKLGSHVEYVAVVQASNDKTDLMIRNMEPPSHSSIDPNRVTSEEVREEYREMLSKAQSRIEAVLREAIGVGSKGEIMEADETLEFFPVEMNGSEGGGNGGWGMLKTAVRNRFKEHGVAAGLGGAGGSGGRGSRGSGGGGSRKRNGRGHGGVRRRPGASHIIRRCAARRNDRLRISFENTADRDIRLTVWPAGEDEIRKDGRPGITDAAILAPVRVDNACRDGWITVPPCSGRMILEVGIPPGSEYSGYEIIEAADEEAAGGGDQ